MMQQKEDSNPCKDGGFGVILKDQSCLPPVFMFLFCLFSGCLVFLFFFAVFFLLLMFKCKIHTTFFSYPNFK